MITCPVCGATSEPAMQINRIAVCSVCGSSIWLNPDGPIARATAAQFATLSSADVERLRHARGQIVRPSH